LSIMRNKHRSLVVLGTTIHCCRQTSLKWLVITTRTALTILLTSRVHLSCASFRCKQQEKGSSGNQNVWPGSKRNFQSSPPQALL